MRIIPFPLTDLSFWMTKERAALRKGLEEPSSLLFVDTRGEHVEFLFPHGADDVADLLESLPLAEDHLADPLA
jgi:hypothetical protein